MVYVLEIETGRWPGFYKMHGQPIFNVIIPCRAIILLIRAIQRSDIDDLGFGCSEMWHMCNGGYLRFSFVLLNVLENIRFSFL